MEQKPNRVRGRQNRERSSLTDFPPTQTVQEGYNEVQTIVETFRRTGIEIPKDETAQYGDVTNLQGKDLTELINEERETLRKVREHQQELNTIALAKAKAQQDQQNLHEDTQNQNLATQPVQHSETQETSQ